MLDGVGDGELALRPGSDFPNCGKGSKAGKEFFGLDRRVLSGRDPRTAPQTPPRVPRTQRAELFPLVDSRNRFSSLGTRVEPVVEHESRHDARLDRARAT